MMRIHSLSSVGSAPLQLRAAVCIVGAGAAGLYLAQRLGESGCQVVVLEAGPSVPVSPEAAGFEAAFPSGVYQGATEGRAFGLGGTTARWGGQLIPFPVQDAIRNTQLMRGVWKHILKVIDTYQHRVADFLGIPIEPTSSQGFPSSLPKELLPLASHWLPFRRRNFAWIPRLPNGNSVDIYCDAVVCDWLVGGGNRGQARVSEAVARSANGRRLRVCAEYFVVAAGAIESGRILQEVNLAGADAVLPSRAAVGQYLSDHLSLQIAATGVSARQWVAAVCGPRFHSGLMRTWRFIEAVPLPGSPRYFTHLIFPSDDHGFRLARAVLQGLQAKRLPAVSSKMLVMGGVGLFRLAWHRLVHSRLFVPTDTASHLQLDMEQRQVSSNRVQLGGATDRYGRPVAIVNWKVSDDDRSDLNRARASFLSHWCAIDGHLTVPGPVADVDLSVKPHNAFHPVGTCRMGDSEESVVGFDLKVHGIDNLRVLSTAVFPSSGSANPTFTLLCFAEMLAEQLNEALLT